MQLNPKEYGLSSRINLQQLANNEIAIVKQVKSRIIKKDALKLIEIANVIRMQEPDTKISLICNNNICSKSVKLLHENDIDIQF